MKINIFASVVALFVVIDHCQLEPHEALCNSVGYPDVCIKTWGCFWHSDGFCAEQDSYSDGEGPCPTPPYFEGYGCKTSGPNFYVYDTAAPYDACSFTEYDSDGTCPTTAQSLTGESLPCVFLPMSSTDQTGGCYVDPSHGSAWDFSEAGICGGRLAGGGCLGIPNCEWVNGSCKPDDLCFYNYTNGGVATSNNACPTIALNGHCSFDAALNICSSDPINGAAKTCMQAFDGTQATCEAAKCEWVPAGTYSAWTGQFDGKYDSYLSFSGWCVPTGSGTSVVSMSAFVVVLLFAGILSLI